MSFFGHLGKTACPFVLHVHVLDVSPVSSTEALHVLLVRSKKQHQTRVAMADGRRCAWDETLTLHSTLYKKGSDAQAEFDKKVYTVTVQAGKGVRRSSLSMQAGSGSSSGAAAGGLQKQLQLSTDIDMATFAAPGNVGKDITRSFPLKGKGIDSGAPTPMLKLTIRAVPSKPGAEGRAAAAAEAANAKHRNGQSMSLSGVTPNPQHESMSSYSRDADISPDVATRPFPKPTISGANPARPGRDEDDDSEDEDEQRKDKHGAGAPAAMGSPGSVPQSFTNGEENATPVPAASPPAKPQLKVKASDGSAGPSGVVSPRAASALSPASERKRRTETQIFTSIMAKAIQSGEDVPASPLPLSRRTSVQSADGAPAPLPSPAARARALQISTGDGDRARAAAAEHAIGTPLTAGLVDEAGSGDLQSYAELDEDGGSPNPAARLKSSIAEDEGPDDVDDEGAAVGSFAERNQQLTVDDILSPGFGGPPSINRAASVEHHSRKPSMYTKQEQASTTRGAASSVLKFFTPNKLSIDAKRKVSGAGAPASSPQPMSATSPRTPKPAPVDNGRRILRQQSMQDMATERSMSGASAHDDLHDTAGVGRGLSLEHSSQQHSRQTSRSPSPSRSLNNTGGSLSVSVSQASSLPPQGHAMTLPAPSPRGKPAFPHSSPAKHSSAHVASRTTGRSPFSSLSKEESARLSSQAQAGGAAAVAAAGDAPAEAGSLASYRAALKERKLRKTSRSTSSTPYGSLQLPENAVQPVLHSASKTLPRPVSTTSLSLVAVAPPSPAGGPSTSPRSASSSLTASARGNRSLSKESSMALTNSTPARPSSAAAAAAATTPATATEAAQLEEDFMARTRPAVELLCAQLHIPELFDVNAAAEASFSPQGSTGSQPATSPSTTESTRARQASSPNGKSLWNSLKRAVSSAAGPEAAAAAAAARATSPSAGMAAAASPVSAVSPAAAVSPTQSDSGSTEASFWFGVPAWSCTVLRCLAGWDAFAVQTFPDETDPSQLRRTAPRSWILSAVLGHLHQTGMRLVAHSAAGQRQKALCFFLSHLVTLIELVEAYQRSPHAPPPFPLIDDGSAAVFDEEAPQPSPAQYDRQLLSPSLPAAFASYRGLFAVPQLPVESSQRVCEEARRRLRGNKQLPTPRAAPGSTAPPLPAGAFPYSVSLGVSTYTWFLSHLRSLLSQTYQGLLDLSLTELELLDPASILSTSQDAMAAADEVSGYEATLDQLQASLSKALEDLQSQRVLPVLQHHFFTCLLRHLNATLFNAVLSSKQLMNMTSGMRLKIVCTALANWARNHRADDAAPDEEESELERIVREETERCKQLALLMLMDKRDLTLQDLSAMCSALTPVSLYHLLINYKLADKDRAGNDDGEERINPAVLDELMEHQTAVMSHIAARAPGQGPPVLFPAWRVAGLVARRPDERGDGIAEEDEESAGGSNEGAAVYDAWLETSARRKAGVEKQKSNVQSPFIDAFQPVPLPRLSSRQLNASPSTKSPTSPTALLPLAAVPVPAPLANDTTYFAFLQRGEQASLVLPVCRGASE